MNFSTYMLVLLITAAVSPLTSTDELAHGQEANNNGNEASPLSLFNGDGALGGIFNVFVSPLRATIDTAKHLLSGQMDNSRRVVTEGLDQIQVNAFKIFMRIYNKTYSPEEIPRRLKLFLERRKAIEQSIKDYISGRMTFAMRENAYIDWDESELKTLSGAKPPSPDELTPEERQHEDEATGDGPGPMEHIVTKKKSDRSSDTLYNKQVSKKSDRNGGGSNLIVKDTRKDIPVAVDWRKTGCISKPMDQEKCGCCYAMATMNVVEAMGCLKKEKAPLLSPQQIIDCATKRRGYGLYGCDGGWPTQVFNYLGNVGVASREACYPFVKRQQSCRLDQMKRMQGCTLAASPTNAQRIKFKVLSNENDILYHVATTGPVVAVIRATDKFLYYGTGIFDDKTCRNRPNDSDHAISIVGYGRENGVDYWLIKNSWGTQWGDKGFAKFRRGKHACSIGYWGWVVMS